MLLALGVLVVGSTLMIGVRLFVARRAPSAAHLGRMSEQWLASHRAGHT